MTQLQNTAFKMKMAPVPFVGDILPKAGAMVVSEHDGHIYYADKYGWHKADAEYSLVTLFIRFKGTDQMYTRFKLPSTASIQIHDGDGTVTDYTGQDDVMLNHETSYTSPGVYVFYISGDVTELTNYLGSLNNPSQIQITGDIAGLTECANLTRLEFNDTEVYGDIAELKKCTLLNRIDFSNSRVYGDLSAMAALPMDRITVENQPGLRWDSETPWLQTTNTYYAIMDSGFSRVEMNRIMKSFSTLTGCGVLVINNKNRSESSDSDVLTFIQNNVYLYVSEDEGVGTLGPELHTDANAASDPNGNEADAVTGWTPAGLDPPNVFESQNIVKAAGVYAFKVNAYPNPTAGYGIEKTFTVTNLSYYRAAFKWRHLGGVDGDYGIGAIWFKPNALNQNCRVGPSDIEFRDVAYYFQSESTEFRALFQEGVIANDGGFYLDDISLREVTLP